MELLLKVAEVLVDQHYLIITEQEPQQAGVVGHMLVTAEVMEV